MLGWEVQDRGWGEQSSERNGLRKADTQVQRSHGSQLDSLTESVMVTNFKGNHQVAEEN